MKAKLALPLVLLLLLASVMTAVAGDVANVLGYDVMFLGAVDNPGNPPTSTWTYAVTADGDEPGALSHWSLALEIASCAVVVAPAEADLDVPPYAYVTPTTDPYGYCAQPGVNCVAGCYEEVSYGYDPTTGVTGITFADATDNGSGLEVENMGDPSKSHIFAIELQGVSAGAQADVPFGIKAPTAATGLISGPVCSTPTAIALLPMPADGSAADMLPPALFAPGGYLAGGAISSLQAARRSRPVGRLDSGDIESIAARQPSDGWRALRFSGGTDLIGQQELVGSWDVAA